MTIPLHSVIMPVLNGRQHIVQGMASALSELGPNDELIVIDNGSTDGSPDLVRSIDDKRIVLLFEPKRGPAAARNRGLRDVRGRYVSFHDHDDLWPAGRLSGMLSALLANPGTNAAYGRVEMRYDGPIDPDYARLDGKGIATFSPSIYLVDADLVRRTGPMDEELIFGEDTDYVLRLQAAGMSAVEYPEICLIYRRHATNMTLDKARANHAAMSVLARNIARRRAQEQPK